MGAVAVFEWREFIYTSRENPHRRSFLKERGRSRPRLRLLLLVLKLPCPGWRVEVGIGVKARAEPDRVAAVGP
jgi:hypothetical protein